MKVKILVESTYSEFKPGRAPGAKPRKVGEIVEFPDPYAVSLVDADLAEALPVEVPEYDADLDDLDDLGIEELDDADLADEDDAPTEPEDVPANEAEDVPPEGEVVVEEAPAEVKEPDKKTVVTKRAKKE